MAGIVSDGIDWGGVSLVDELCGLMGITPPPIREWVDQLDFDPEPTLQRLDQLNGAQGTIQAGAAPLVDAKPTADVWTGGGAQGMVLHAECQRTFWGHVGDFLLWIAENLVQLLDYIVDFLRIVVAWITWIVTAFTIAAAVIIMIVAAVGGAGIGAIFGALVDSTILAVAGAIAAVGIIVSLLLAALNALFDWLEDIIRAGRDSICGKGLPSLPDWDPEGWEPPAWPV